MREREEGRKVRRERRIKDQEKTTVPKTTLPH